MTLLFRRKYELIVGDPGEEGVSITDLHITFEIKSTTKSDSNTCIINIYNLSEEKRGLITDDSVVSLKVGYGESLNTLFLGEVSFKSTQNQGQDIITRLVIRDGWVPSREGYTNIKFTDGATLQQIISLLVKEDLGLGEVTFNNGNLGAEAGINTAYPSGKTIQGNTLNVLEDLCLEADLDIHIQLGKVIVQARDAVSEEKAAIISGETGLIGSVEKFIDSTGKLKGDDKASNAGVKFKTLMDPLMTPGKAISVETNIEDVNGVYKIVQVNHKGSFEGPDWFSVVEAKKKDVTRSE